MVVCETAHKPMILFYLIHTLDVKNAIVFTKSAESTARLVQLFDFFESSRLAFSQNASESNTKVVIQSYSSDLSPGDRRAVLEKFRDQNIHMYVPSAPRS